MKRWIVMANKVECIIFEKKSGYYSKVHYFSNPKLNEKESELFTDRAGTSRTTYTSDQTSISENHYFEQLARMFALDITNYLEKQRDLHRFDKLTIISGPAFMGALRDSMPQPLKLCWDTEIVRNFYTEKVHELMVFFNEDTRKLRYE